MKTILVTGGLGFIGSHTCVNLLESGFRVLIVDSNKIASNSIIQRIKQIGKLNNLDFTKKVLFFEGDIRDETFLTNVFDKARKNGTNIDAVIHFAGLKSVKESVRNPLKYWDVNVNGSINLFRVMNQQNCKTVVFSSSATVYGYYNKDLTEDLDLNPSNPYGFTKVAIEKVLKNIFDSDKDNWRIANLRYFNPIGAHPTGLIGENPKNIPENIFPYICQVALGIRNKLFVFGNDWPTKDGTCVRDYIHIMDLAEAHKSALNFLQNNDPQNIDLNIGTGKGTTVLELIAEFNFANKCSINFEFANRRNGDVAQIKADIKKVSSILKWNPKNNLKNMCIDGLKWQKLNPNGFE